MGKDAEAENAVPEDIAAKSFEAALAELEEIVDRLERGDVSLDESIAIYTRGAQLKRHCEAKLRAAQDQVDKIVLKADGSIAAEPADIA